MLTNNKILFNNTLTKLLDICNNIIRLYILCDHMLYIKKDYSNFLKYVFLKSCSPFVSYSQILKKWSKENKGFRRSRLNHL